MLTYGIEINAELLPLDSIKQVSCLPHMAAKTRTRSQVKFRPSSVSCYLALYMLVISFF